MAEKSREIELTRELFSNISHSQEYNCKILVPMQNLFSNLKRKHSLDGGNPDERDAKHTKHNVSLSYPAQFNDSHITQNRYSYTSGSSKSIERLSQNFKPSLDFTDSKPKASSSQKLTNLLSALNDALEEDGMDEILRLIDDESIQRCLDLRSSLSKHKSKIDAPAINTLSASQPQPKRSHDDFWNLPKTMSPFSVTPWKSSQIPLSLPPLPEVLDPTLEQSAFVHLGLGSGKATDLSYERLEWVGDAYVYLISTLLISQTFPAFTPGKCSQLRERLVKNLTLADYSRRYGFDKRAKLPDYLYITGKDQERTKVMGDIFESYVAAIVLSDPADGVKRASEWLKDIWGMTLAKEILQEERNGLLLDSPLWRLRGKAEPVQQIIDKSQPIPLNPKEQLAKLLGSRGVQIVYKDAAPEKKDPKNKLAMFTVGVYLTGWGEKDKMLGSGRANGKKDAGMKAAEMALANKKMMKMYMDKKRVFDEQTDLERAAMERHGDI
jgi:ribonuclease III